MTPGASGGRPTSAHWPAEDVATLAELLHRLNRIGEAVARRARPGEEPED